MRRIRISTWVLVAIFVTTLIVYVLVKPSSASTTHPPKQTPRPHSTSPAPGMPLPGFPGGQTQRPEPASHGVGPAATGLTSLSEAG